MDTAKHKKMMLEALEASGGNIKTAAKAVGIARHTHYDWLKSDDEYKQAVEDIVEGCIDDVESVLYEAIRAKDITATIFFLKTRAKSRGYTEKVEQLTEVKAEVKQEGEQLKLDNLPTELVCILADYVQGNYTPQDAVQIIESEMRKQGVGQN